MINHFLTALDNRSTTFPGVYREATEPILYTGRRRSLQLAVLGEVEDAGEHLARAAMVVSLLRASPLFELETAVDDRLTYDDSQLAAIIAGAGVRVVSSSSARLRVLSADSRTSGQLVFTSPATLTYGPYQATIQTGASGSNAVRLGSLLVQVIGVPADGDSWEVDAQPPAEFDLALAAQRVRQVAPDLEDRELLTDLLLVCNAAAEVVNG